MGSGIKKRYSEFQDRLYLEAGLSYANFTLLNGVFLVGFALALGASSFQIGLFAAIPLLANLLQFVTPFVLEALGTKKWTSVLSLSAARILWIPIAAIALSSLFTDSPMSVFFWVLILSSIFTAIGNVSLLSWIKDSVPSRRLTGFLGRRNVYAGVFGISVYLACSYIVDKRTGISVFGHVFLFATGLGIAAVLLLLRIPEKKARIKAISWKRLWSNFRLPFSDEMFKPLLRFGIAWGFFINVLGPFFWVLLIDDLKLSFSIIALFMVADTIGRVYGLNLWVRVVERFGSKPVITVAVTVSAFCPLVFILMSSQNFLLFILVTLVWSFAFAGVDIAVLRSLFRHSPQKTSAYYLSTYSAIIGLASALGPIAGGLIATAVKSGAHPALTIMHPMKYLLVATFVGRMLCLPLIPRLYEPKARSVDDVLGRLRRLRYVSLFTNVYSLASYSSKVVLVPQRQLFVIQRKTADLIREDLEQSVAILNSIVNSLSNGVTVGTPRFFSRVRSIKDLMTEHTNRISYATGTVMHSLSDRTLEMVDRLEKSIETGGRADIRKEAKRLIEKSMTYRERLIRMHPERETRKAPASGNAR